VLFFVFYLLTRLLMDAAARSWSYDNLKTYPVMQLPPKKEKRVQKKMVDGVEVDYEVEVEVVEPMKRLFLFPGRETVRAR